MSEGPQKPSSREKPSSVYNVDPILRIVRRIAHENVDEFAKFEKLRSGSPLDLEPSAYVVPADMSDGTTQMHAEHLSVMTGTPNATPRYHVDARGLPFTEAVREAGQTKFAFTRDAHVYLSLKNEGALDAFVAALYGRLPNVVTVELSLLRAYIRHRYEANDAEWRTFIDSGDPKSTLRWRKWLDKN